MLLEFSLIIWQIFNAGAPGLADNMTKYFYKHGKVIIDALINPFVFSLTVTGF